jgi:hypothetical protein
MKRSVIPAKNIKAIGKPPAAGGEEEYFPKKVKPSADYRWFTKRDPSIRLIKASRRIGPGLLFESGDELVSLFQ